MKILNGVKLKEMLISGSNNLYNHYPEVDALNVFPVPDGDTGINMNLTLSSGVKEIANRNDTDIYQIAKSFSKGLLMGARGNSGVITSQIFRGFAEAMEGKKELNAFELAEAFNQGREVAYRAVIKPVEGTILTVIREASQVANQMVEKNTSIEELMGALIKEAKASLERTPELLPILEEAGVVDSGGTGLVMILEGMISALHGKIIEKEKATAIEEKRSAFEAGLEGDEEFGYCTEFILRLITDGSKKEFNLKRFIGYLNGRGNSIVAVRDEDIVKVHIHTLRPGEILSYAQNFGEFVTLKIENMTEQHNTLIEKIDDDESHKEVTALPNKKKEKYAIIAVSAGSGIDEIFTQGGISQIVHGGQTMNPSTEDFIAAIKKCHAENIYILPNNSNIILAASQACEVMAKEVNARVIPTKTIPQGITASMIFNPSLSPEENFKEMKACLKSVKSGSVTFAIKDTTLDGVKITKDHFMAITDKKILASVPSKVDAAEILVRKMIDNLSEIVTVIVGEDVTQDESDKLQTKLEEEYEDVEFEFFNGKQPVYSFIIGID